MSNTSFRSLLGDAGQSDSSSGVSAELKQTKEEINKYCTLTKKQRMYGFAISFCAGWALSIGGLFALANPILFAILYSCGSICALASTMFIFGPLSQLKTMFKPIRRAATIIYLITIVTTLVFAFVLEDPTRGPLVLLSLAVQFVAMVWYVASYVPYGRKMIKKMIGGVCKSVADDAS